MLRKYGLPFLALFGVILGLIAVYMSTRKPPTPAIPYPPAESPYRHFIAGFGVVEASSENINIGTSIPEIVTEVYVVAGDFVKKNDPLFKLDTRTYEAEAYEAQAAQARAIVEYESNKTELDLYEKLTDRRAVSENEYNQIYFATEAARVAIEQAEARIQRAQSFIERSTIRAPLDGQILQVAIRPGEIANLNPFTRIPLITFGPVCPSHLRINIDEEDAWRYRAGSPGIAFIRGNSSICFPLKYVRTEPLLIPKQDLTGDTSERVDTRVLQVIYSFECDHLPVYIGQLLDVFIESIPATTRYKNEEMDCR